MRKRLALACFLALSAPAIAQQTQGVTLVNRTPDTIVAVSIRAVATESWGPDLLDEAVRINDETVRLRLPTGSSQCRFDVRVSYAGGDTTELRNLDLCRGHAITLGADDEEETEIATTTPAARG